MSEKEDLLESIAMALCWSDRSFAGDPDKFLQAAKKYWSELDNTVEAAHQTKYRNIAARILGLSIHRDLGRNKKTQYR
jgi:hypothetical protein